MLRLVVLLVAALAWVSPSHAADDYPSHPITLIVPFPAGGGVDVIGRIVADKLAAALGQPVVIDNRGGAAGVIGTRVAAKATPDGYTLVMATSGSIASNPNLYVNPGYHTLKDLSPIGLISSTPIVLMAHPSAPENSLADVIAAAKRDPGKLNIGTPPPGTSAQLAGELFKAMAGLDIVHVPFREANSALNAVVAGNVQMMFSIATTTQSQINAGTVRGLGVTTLEPTRLVPNVPSIAQSGLSGFEVTGWNGLVAPAGTPGPIIVKLNSALRRGVDDAETRKRLETAGYEVAAPNTPDDFAKFIQVDTERWISIVEKANISMK
jgi:tripartite-type tricarboxylate transporter receptor subunit TctC